MFPSNNLFALIRAYDLTAQPAKSIGEFRSQGQQFIEEIRPYAKALSPLFKGLDRSVNRQSRFDALLSIAYDIGLDLFFDSGLPAIIGSDHSRKHLNSVFGGIPTFDGTLRPELAIQMQSYRMRPLSRRKIELLLYLGSPIFCIGRCKSADGTIVYSVSVMHPFFQFSNSLYRGQKHSS